MWTFQQIINTFVLLQFDEPHIIPCIDRQHISMLAYFFFSLHFIVDISHFDRLRLSNFIFFFFTTLIILKNDVESGCIYSSAQSKLAQYSKCFLSDNCNVHSLTAKKLEHIPEIIATRV